MRAEITSRREREGNRRLAVDDGATYRDLASRALRCMHRADVEGVEGPGGLELLEARNRPGFRSALARRKSVIIGKKKRRTESRPSH